MSKWVCSSKEYSQVSIIRKLNFSAESAAGKSMIVVL
jgi:hypothetical protein